MKDSSKPFYQLKNPLEYFTAQSALVLIAKSLFDAENKLNLGCLRITIYSEVFNDIDEFQQVIKKVLRVNVVLVNTNYKMISQKLQRFCWRTKHCVFLNYQRSGVKYVLAKEIKESLLELILNLVCGFRLSFLSGAKHLSAVMSNEINRKICNCKKF